MSEGQSQIEIYKNLSKIRKGLDYADESKRDLSILKKEYKHNDVNTINKTNDLGKDFMFNLPKTKGPEELHKDKEGVREIILGVLVQADILSKRTDVRSDTRGDFKNLVERGMKYNGITSEEIASATIERGKETQKKLIKDSEKIINEAKYQMSKIKESLGAMGTPEQASEVDLLGLIDTKSRLVSLSAQIKDLQTINEIESVINDIDEMRTYIINTINSEISKTDILHDSEDGTIKLDKGRYRVSLEIPNVGMKLCNVEVVDLTSEDVEIKSGENGLFSKRPFKAGDRVVRLTYVRNGPHTSVYHMDELNLLNESLTKEDFTKRES